MEESLILQELLELYDATTVRQTRMIEAMGSMMGGMFVGGGSVDSGSDNNTVVLYGEEDKKYLPKGLGIGFETA